MPQTQNSSIQTKTEPPGHLRSQADVIGNSRLTLLWTCPVPMCQKTRYRIVDMSGPLAEAAESEIRRFCEEVQAHVCGA
jgi:hypothetical protein